MSRLRVNPLLPATLVILLAGHLLWAALALAGVAMAALSASEGVRGAGETLEIELDLPWWLFAGLVLSLCLVRFTLAGIASGQAAAAGAPGPRGFGRLVGAIVRPAVDGSQRVAVEPRLWRSAWWRAWVVGLPAAVGAVAAVHVIDRWAIDDYDRLLAVALAAGVATLGPFALAAGALMRDDATSPHGVTFRAVGRVARANPLRAVGSVVLPFAGIAFAAFELDAAPLEIAVVGATALFIVIESAASASFRRRPLPFATPVAAGDGTPSNPPPKPAADRPGFTLRRPVIRWGPVVAVAGGAFIVLFTGKLAPLPMPEAPEHPAWQTLDGRSEVRRESWSIETDDIPIWPRLPALFRRMLARYDLDQFDYHDDVVNNPALADAIAARVDGAVIDRLIRADRIRTVTFLCECAPKHQPRLLTRLFESPDLTRDELYRFSVWSTLVTIAERVIPVGADHWSLDQLQRLDRAVAGVRDRLPRPLPLNAWHDANEIAGEEAGRNPGGVITADLTLDGWSMRPLVDAPWSFPPSLRLRLSLAERHSYVRAWLRTLPPTAEPGDIAAGPAGLADHLATRDTWLETQVAGPMHEAKRPRLAASALNVLRITVRSMAVERLTGRSPGSVAALHAPPAPGWARFANTIDPLSVAGAPYPLAVEPATGGDKETFGPTVRRMSVITIELFIVLPRETYDVRRPITTGTD
jgi:hypothetical protein